MSNSTTHKHLCNQCGNTFDCGGEDCAEFEFSTCEECKAKQKTSSPSRRSKKERAKQ